MDETLKLESMKTTDTEKPTPFDPEYFKESGLIDKLTPKFTTPQTVKENIKILRQAMDSILQDDDVAMIKGKRHIKKSGWNILNQYFGVNIEPIKSWRTELENNEYMITVVAQASLDGKNKQARSASCTSIEWKQKHDGKEYIGMESHIYGMAETRAVGRVSAAWYMIADTSAEEMENISDKEQIPNGTTRACKCKTPKCEPNSRECKECGGLDLS